MLHIDFIPNKDCWNRYEAFHSCVHCGCCGEDIDKRTESRILVLQRLLKEEYEFDRWADDPALRALQEENIRLNIRYFKRMLSYYQNRRKTNDTKEEEITQ